MDQRHKSDSEYFISQYVDHQFAKADSQLSSSGWYNTLLMKEEINNLFVL